MYGTNAYAGVINIITTNSKKPETGSFAMKYGTFNTKNYKMTAGKNIRDFSLFFAADYNESDGYTKKVTWDEDDVNPNGGLFGSSNGSRTLGYYSDDPSGYENDYFNLFTSIKYKSLSINGNYFNNQKDKFGIIPTLASTGERTLEGFAGNVKYDHLFNDNLRTSIILWHDRVSKDERVNRYVPVLRAPGYPVYQQYAGAKTGTQVELGLTRDNFNLVGGLGYESSLSDPYIYFFADSVARQVQNTPANAYAENKSTYDIWSFAQGIYQINKNLSLMAGARVNSNQQAGAAIIPNAGIVFKPVDKLSIKLLYGMGYRNPSYFEKYVRTVNTLAGSATLQTEKVNNIDIGIEYHLKSYSFRLNGYFMQTSSEIARAPLSPEDITRLNAEPGFGTGNMNWTTGVKYVNTDGNKYSGVEFSFLGYPHRALSFNGNLSYKMASKSNGDPITEFSPLTANLMLNVKAAKRFNITPFIQYIGERKVHYKALYPWNTWGEGDEVISAYTLVNLRMSFDLAEGFSIGVLAKNLFDTEYFYPEYIRKGIPYIPGGPGRSVFAEISYKF